MANNIKSEVVNGALSTNRDKWVVNIELCRATLEEIINAIGDDEVYKILGQTGGSVDDLLESLQRACKQMEVRNG